MALKVISMSIDESVLEKADEMVKSNVEIANRSHLITVAILKEYARFKKAKDTK